MDELTDDAITKTFRLFQRKRGHRYSNDDVVTAWEAANAVSAPAQCLDMGCGIGSVLHIVAYKHPKAFLTGVEAQDVSFELVKRNVERNELGARVTLIHGDLRTVTLPRTYDLVTGTPPYVPVGQSVPSPDAQRAHCRIELRGGVEDYLAAGKKWLAPGGRLVVCADARFPRRVLDTAPKLGLAVLRRRDVVPRAVHKQPLFAVWTLGHAAEGGTLEVMPELVLSDEAAQPTAAAHALRNFVDMPLREF
jgi:tRNA1Val (adenine37-N6)-methyltransferase